MDGAKSQLHRAPGIHCGPSLYTSPLSVHSVSSTDQLSTSWSALYFPAAAAKLLQQYEIYRHLLVKVETARLNLRLHAYKCKH